MLLARHRSYDQLILVPVCVLPQEAVSSSVEQAERSPAFEMGTSKGRN